MRARVNKQQAREGLLQALSCRPGAECAKAIIMELVDTGVIPLSRARDYAMCNRYKEELRKPAVSPALALKIICEEFNLAESTAKEIVRK